MLHVLATMDLLCSHCEAYPASPEYTYLKREQIVGSFPAASVQFMNDLLLRAPQRKSLFRCGDYTEEATSLQQAMASVQSKKCSYL